MKAAAIARGRWARRRLTAASGAVMPGWTTARITTILLLALAVATVACAAIGLVTTQRNASRMQADRHAALERELDELHVVFGDVVRFDTGQIQFLERRAGLEDLRFEADLTADDSRETQSLHD